MFLRLRLLIVCVLLCSMCHLPPELSHWWGRRRGRTGGGGAILWGATDRDGMGGPGEGDTGESAEKQLPTQWSHQGITLSTPPQPTFATTFLFFSLPVFSHFFTHTTCLLLAMVDWPVHAFAGLFPPVVSMLRTQFVLFVKLHDLSAERWCS